MSDTHHITLTGRRPVTVNDDAWPIVAEAESLNDNAPNPPNRRSVIYIRQHADGRNIVYGWFRSAWQGEPDATAGYILDAPDDGAIAGAVADVAERIDAPAYMVDAVMADLPAEVL